jgi:Na+/proline symporter
VLLEYRAYYDVDWLPRVSTKFQFHDTTLCESVRNAYHAVAIDEQRVGFLPIYLGPVLVFLFGGPLLNRVIRISKRHNITSIADFIGARYGRHQPIAMLVTAIAVVGVLPYIALQLKAVSSGFEVLVGTPADTVHLVDGALTIALM